MIRQALRIDPRRTGPMDVGLIGFAALLASFSICQSVGSLPNAIFLGVAIIVGMCFSFAMGRYAAKSRFIRMDSILYATAAILAFTFKGSLNLLLPDSTLFSDNALSVAGGICWMLVIGSFLTWRDSTLLFQAVPSLAIFGLVGCFDTFKEATLLFFVFILCLATLMARAHGRLMMKQAEDSGHKRISDLGENAWRWMAGPEWALASATAVVMLSILGAPVIQEEAHNLGISGLVHIQPPAKNRSTPALFSPQPSGSVSVGQGPNHLSSDPVLRAQLEHVDYLRSNSYYEYTGSGWGITPRNIVGRGKSLVDYSQQMLDNPVQTPYGIEILKTQLRFLPVPGLPTMARDQLNIDKDWDGSLEMRQTFVNLPRIQGLSLEAPQGAKPTNAPATLDPEFDVLRDADKIPPTIKKLAEQVTRGATNDYEKARMIESAIARRCVYNLNAKATPAGEDPVEYFLFTSHEGYCDLFASAMVAMARSVGLPARYTVGYLPDPVTTNGYYIVKESDAHAWCEILFEKTSWTIFDATIGAGAVEGGQRGQSTDQPWYKSTFFKFTAIPGLIAALGYVVFFAIRRYRSPKVIQPRKELSKVYAKFERALLPLAGHPRRLSQTTSEYVDASKGKLGRLYPKATELNREFEMALYGFEEPHVEDIEKLKESVNQFKAETKNTKDLVGAGRGKNP